MSPERTQAATRYSSLVVCLYYLIIFLAALLVCAVVNRVQAKDEETRRSRQGKKQQVLAKYTFTMLCLGCWWWRWWRLASIKAKQRDTARPQRGDDDVDDARCDK